jgi:RloB-like protein
MGKDNQPKHRQARDLKRRAAQRASYERLLIICEGEKTEPCYLLDIRKEYRLHTANVQVQPSTLGTTPVQVVEYAEKLFRYGNRHIRIGSCTFDRVIVVFDRDDHATYLSALDKVDALNKALKNDEGQWVPFQAIVSVPCFELWLLLHFEDVHAPIHREDVFGRLKTHLPAYDKGQGGHWAATKDHLEIATSRARARSVVTNVYDGNEPITAMHELVSLLTNLRGKFKGGH